MTVEQLRIEVRKLVDACWGADWDWAALTVHHESGGYDDVVQVGGPAAGAVSPGCPPPDGGPSPPQPSAGR
jgi:hypothetical protein